MSNHINEILFALTDAGVEFVVGGGVAAVLHGVERVTLDIDLALDMEPANVEKFLQVMHQLGLQPRVPVPARDLMSREAVERMIAEKGDWSSPSWTSIDHCGMSTYFCRVIFRLKS